MSDTLRREPNLDGGFTRPAPLNPYAPPAAEVADRFGGPDGEVQPVRLFTVQGRIGRARLLAYWMYSALLFQLMVGVLSAITAATGAPWIALAVMVLLAIPYFWFSICILAKRSHDMGWSGWTALWTLVPLVALLWIFAAGTPGRNRFGAPPPPNSLSVKIGAWLLPVFFVVGILAAIALPAYQGYVQRAQAVQGSR